MVLKEQDISPNYQGTYRYAVFPKSCLWKKHALGGFLLTDLFSLKPSHDSFGTINK